MALLIERAQAQKAQALASEIRNQTVLEEAGDDVATLKAIGSYGPLHHGPGIEASPENETPVTLVKPHKHLSTWLEAIDLASFADAFREQGMKTRGESSALVRPVCRNQNAGARNPNLQ